MRILHIGLASFFTEGMKYQDNQLAHQNCLDGHEVTYISNAQKYVDGIVTNTGFQDTVLNDGLRLIRLPYKRIINEFVSSKLRFVSGLYQYLEEIKPDVIMSHDLCYASIIDVIKYKKNHPEIKLYADTHTAYYNSGSNWVSLHILHRLFYRALIQKALPVLEKYFYVGAGEYQFNIDNYGVPKEIMEYFPLGGNILSQEGYFAARNKRRNELGMTSKQRLYIHSGKLGSFKRTEELLKAFSSVNDQDARLAIIGTIDQSRMDDIQRLIDGDARIMYLGWKSGDELIEYLCAGDLYCQPGSVSATMQNAICCNCAIMAYPHLPYTTHLDWGNILWVETQEDMEAVFKSISENPEQLNALKENSHKCAVELLDYRKLAARLYE